MGSINEPHNSFFASLTLQKRQYLLLWASYPFTLLMFIVIKIFNELYVRLYLNLHVGLSMSNRRRELKWLENNHYCFETGIKPCVTFWSKIWALKSYQKCVFNYFRPVQKDAFLLYLAREGVRQIFETLYQTGKDKDFETIVTNWSFCVITQSWCQHFPRQLAGRIHRPRNNKVMLEMATPDFEILLSSGINIFNKIWG